MPTQPSSASSGGTSAGSGGGAAGALNVVTGVVDAAATIANTIAGITDANKRRLIEANLNILSEKERNELAKQISRQNNKNAQATILINTIMAARDAAANREQKSQTIKWVLIGSAGVATLAILAWYLKS